MTRDRWRTRRWWWTALALGIVLPACGGDGGDGLRRAAPTTTPGEEVVTTAPVTLPPTTTAPITTPAPATTVTTRAPRATTTSTSTTAPATTAPGPVPEVEVAYRVERRVDDEATAGFAAVVEATLSDERGWLRAGFRLVRRDDAPYLIVLAEGPEVDRLCLPHDTYGEYSCQRSETVALNAERWREATPKWTGDLATYRQMLVNHEVGHLLGQPHPKLQCPRPGGPAPLMAQQSTELDGCLPNPWPLDTEIAAAARHDRPLAPL